MVDVIYATWGREANRKRLVVMKNEKVKCVSKVKPEPVKEFLEKKGRDRRAKISLPQKKTKKKIREG